MIDFITLYRERQGIRFRMTKIKHLKNSEDEYQKLKEAEVNISKQLDKIIEHEKRIKNQDKK